MSGSAFDIVLDELTLARARRGDVLACESIYRLYKGPAYTIAYRICQCPTLAQDVLQEAFINAFKRLKQFRGDAPFWGWLRRVVINQAISMLRRQPDFAPMESAEYHSSVEGDQGRVELSSDLADAFAQLESQDRTVVWMHDVEGYNHSEIAEMFGMTESFSKTRLSRARARLRELLGQHMNPAGDDEPGSDVGGSFAADTSAEVASNARSYSRGNSTAGGRSWAGPSRASMHSAICEHPGSNTLRATGASLHTGSSAADTIANVASNARSYRTTSSSVHAGSSGMAANAGGSVSFEICADLGRPLI